MTVCISHDFYFVFHLSISVISEFNMAWQEETFCCSINHNHMRNCNEQALSVECNPSWERHMLRNNIRTTKNRNYNKKARKLKLPTKSCITVTISVQNVMFTCLSAAFRQYLYGLSTGITQLAISEHYKNGCIWSSAKLNSYSETLQHQNARL